MGGFTVGADTRWAEESATTKQTSFDQYLEERLQDLAARLEHAGETRRLS